MGKKENFLSRIFFVIFLFIFINYPPWLKINMLHLVGIFSYFYLFFNSKYVTLHGLTGRVLLLICMIASVFLSVMLGTNRFKNLILFFEILIDIIPGALVCVCYSNKYNIKKEEFLKILFWVSFVQGVLSLITFIFPPLQMFFLYRALSYGFDSSKYLTFLGRRYYGSSYNLVTYLPVLQSLMTIILLEYSINKERKYFCLIPLIMFSAIINSRSSFILLFIGLIIVLFRKLNMKRIFLLGFGVSLLIIGFIILYYNLYYISLKTFLWMSEGLMESYNFLVKGETEGNYFSTITNLVEKIPTGLDLFLGIGELSIGGNSSGVSCDVGYINYLWLGGILIFILFHVFFFSKFIYLIKDNNDYIRLFGYLAIIYSIIFNIKMPIFLLNECSIIFIILYFVVYNINKRDYFEINNYYWKGNNK